MNTLNTNMIELRVQFILERHELLTRRFFSGFESYQCQLRPSITEGMVRDSLNKGMF